MNSLENIFNKIESKQYDSTYCFLCGEILDDENNSKEHVFPKWLQDKYNLWDQEIYLLNGTAINYRQLTIPCCRECNNNYLSPLENKIALAERQGFNSFKKLDKLSIFLWVGKIYYGLIYKELFLFKDRSNPSLGLILNKEYLDSFKSHYLFLQTIRNLHRFKDFFPASIYIVETQKPLKLEDQWDFSDRQAKMFISMRFGQIGIIVALQDCQCTEKISHHLYKFYEIPLHPLQFNELCAQIYYKLILLNRTPKFFSFQNDSDTDQIIETIQLPIMGLSSKPIYDDWVMSDYAKILSYITGIPANELNPEKDKIYTWIKNEKDETVFMDIEKYKL